jgi:hypothetical protein
MKYESSNKLDYCFGHCPLPWDFVLNVWKSGSDFVFGWCRREKGPYAVDRQREIVSTVAG